MDLDGLTAGDVNGADLNRGSPCMQQDGRNAPKWKMVASVRLVLVDRDNESRLLGCVVCRPSFIAENGDCPSALINALQLTRKSKDGDKPPEPVPVSALEILSVTSKEVTIGLKSETKSESCFESEAKVVFIESERICPSPGSESKGSSHPEDGNVAIEGLVLVEDRSASTDNSAATVKFRYVYARSDAAGVYWFRSRSEYLTYSNNPGGMDMCLGSFLFRDLVAMRQSRRRFEFDSEATESLGAFSTLEFVFREGSSVTMAMGFPFPLVQWLFAAHAALKLPRMFIAVSQSGNWMATLCGRMNEFSLASPLVLECFQYSCTSKRLGFSITSGCGGSIVDCVQAFVDDDGDLDADVVVVGDSKEDPPIESNESLEEGKRKETHRKQSSGAASSSLLQRTLLGLLKPTRQVTSSEDSSSSPPESPNLRKQQNRKQSALATRKNVSFMSSPPPKRAGSYTPSVGMAGIVAAAMMTRSKSVSASNHNNGSIAMTTVTTTTTAGAAAAVEGTTRWPLEEEKGVSGPAIVLLPSQPLKTPSPHLSAAPISSAPLATFPIHAAEGESSRLHPQQPKKRVLIDLLDNSASLPSKPSQTQQTMLNISTGDLIIKVNGSWVMDNSSWRATRDLILTHMEQRRQDKEHPLEIIFGRVAPLSVLGTTQQQDDLKLLKRVAQVQQVLWASSGEAGGARHHHQLNRRRSSNTSVASSSETDGPANNNNNMLSFHRHCDMRRRAATRQLMRRQTTRVAAVEKNAPLVSTLTTNPSSFRVSTTLTEKEPISTASTASMIGSSSGGGTMMREDDSRASYRQQQPIGTGESLPKGLPKALSVAKLSSSSSDKAKHTSGRNPSKSPSVKENHSLLKRLTNVSLKRPVSLRPLQQQKQEQEQQQQLRWTMALSPLVQRVGNTSLSMQDREDAAGLLLKLTADKLNQSSAGPSAIPTAIAVLLEPSSSDLLMERCAGCLWNLSDLKENALLIAQRGGVQALTRILQLQSVDEAVKEEACGALWALVHDEANASLMVLTGALGPLVKMLDVEKSSSFLQENASGCLWSLSSLPSARRLLMDPGTSAPPLMPLLFRLLKEGTTITKENLIGVLSNLFVDSPDAKDQVLMRKGVQKIVQAVMFGQTITLKENAAVAMMEMARDSTEIKLAFAQEGALTALLKLLLTANDMNVKAKAAEAIRVLAADIPEIKQQLSELGSVPEVLRMLEEAKRSLEERVLSMSTKRQTRAATGTSEGSMVVSTFSSSGAISPSTTKAEIIKEPHFRLEDLGAGKRYVHFDSVVLHSGLEEVLLKASREQQQQQQQQQQQHHSTSSSSLRKEEETESSSSTTTTLFTTIVSQGSDGNGGGGDDDDHISQEGNKHTGRRVVET